MAASSARKKAPDRESNSSKLVSIWQTGTASDDYEKSGLKVKRGKVKETASEMGATRDRQVFPHNKTQDPLER